MRPFMSRCGLHPVCLSICVSVCLSVSEMATDHDHFTHTVVVIGCDMAADPFHQDVPHCYWPIDANWVKSAAAGLFGVVRPDTFDTKKPEKTGHYSWPTSNPISLSSVKWPQRYLFELLQTIATVKHDVLFMSRNTDGVKCLAVERRRNNLRWVSRSISRSVLTRTIGLRWVHQAGQVPNVEYSCQYAYATKK